MPSKKIKLKKVVCLAKSPLLDPKEFYDIFKKSPLHYVVNPLPYGSYENEAMLKALIPKCDVN